MNDVSIPSGAVVVGVDGSEQARAAVAWAARLAGDEGRPLVLLNALDDVWSEHLIGASHPGDRAHLVAVATRESRALVDDELRLARRLAPGVAVLSVASATGPREALLAAARRGAAMVVVGSHGRGPLRSLMLGSVSEAVARTAECPVVVVRPGCAVRSAGRGVLVGVDGSRGSVPVVEAGFRIASERGLRLTVLHVWSDWREAVETSRAGPPTGQGALDGAGDSVAGSMAALRDAYPDVTVRVAYVSGPPAMRLVAEADGFDILVIGRDVRGPVGRLTHASVATSVIERAACPVMVVPLDRGRERSEGHRGHRARHTDLADAG